MKRKDFLSLIALISGVSTVEKKPIKPPGQLMAKANCPSGPPLTYNISNIYLNIDGADLSSYVETAALNLGFNNDNRFTVSFITTDEFEYALQNLWRNKSDVAIIMKANNSTTTYLNPQYAFKGKIIDLSIESGAITKADITFWIASPVERTI